MIDIAQEEIQRLREEIASLRLIIIRADPSVMIDGRFEQMITTPTSVLVIARELISRIPELLSAEAWM